MRKIKSVLEAVTAIISAGLLAVQMGQSLPLDVAYDAEQAAIVFMLKA